MNRRDMLLAATGALASAAAGSAFARTGGAPLPPIGGSSGATSGASCALIPVQPAPRSYRGVREICMKRFFPSQVGGAGQSLDMLLQAGQLERHRARVGLVEQQQVHHQLRLHG